MEKLTRVRFTNLEKILYPSLMIKKSQVIEYYIRIAPRMLNMLAGRALVTNRFPDGINKGGFYEKAAPKGTPPWVQTFKRYSETSGRDIDYIVCNDLDTLVWLANLAALEIHITLSTVDSYEIPDLVLFDIDPEPPAGFDEAVEVAKLLKDKLDTFDLRSFIKTTGKRGLHVVLPIVYGYTYRQTREFVHQFGKHLARESELVASEFSRSKQPGTVHIDYRQNAAGRTMISPYSLRAEKQVTVSTPLDWRDLKKGLKPTEFNIFSVMKKEDAPWEGIWAQRQRLDVK